MASVAVIENNVVGSVINAPSTLWVANNLTPQYAVDITGMAGVGVGWTYDGGLFTAPVAPAITYMKYTYIEFLGKLMEGADPLSRKILRLKKQDSDTAADVEVFMEMIKHTDGVDFNSAVSRGRMASLVPTLVTQLEADEIMIAA